MENKEVVVLISELRKVRQGIADYRKQLESLKTQLDILRAENENLKAMLEINKERGNF